MPMLSLSIHNQNLSETGGS